MSIGMKGPNTFSNLGVGYGNMRAQCVESSKIRLLVLTEYAGYMIGRGGENVRRLRTKYNVNINGLDRQGKEVAVLQITGPRDAALEAIAELLPLCPKAYFVSGKHHRTHDVNLLVNQKLCGLLIVQYKQICEEFGTILLKVHPTPLPGSDERVVAVSDHNVPVLIAALTKILNVLDQSTEDSDTKFFDPTTQTLPKPVILQEESLQFPRLNPQLQDRGSPPQSRNAGLDTVEGQPLCEPPALNQIAAMLVEERDRQTSNGEDASNDMGFAKTTTILTISDKLCALVMGTEGRNIEYIKQTSGATIEFSEARFDQQERTVVMSGTPVHNIPLISYIKYY